MGRGIIGGTGSAALVALFFSSLSAHAAEDGMKWHSAIGLTPEVKALGKEGAGSEIAILDTGVSKKAGSLKWSMNQSNSVSMVGSPTDWDSDSYGHGTAVASVVAGSSSGVAPKARLMSVKIGEESANDSAIAAGIRHAADHGADSINISFSGNDWSSDGLFVPELAEALKYAASKSVIVIAAGNEGEAKLNRLAMHLLLKGVAGSGIIMGSVDGSNVDSWFSNVPGEWAWDGSEARDFYMKAPGEDIPVLNPDGSSREAFGTSFSSPIGDGGVSLVKAHSPHLTSNQIVEILLKSAQDLGEAGTDGVYGRGLLRIDRALSPIGTTRVATGSRVAGVSFSVNSTGVRSGAAMGSASGIRSALRGSVMFDGYNRVFPVELGANVTSRTAAGLRLDRPLGNKNTAPSPTRLSVAPGLWLSAALSDREGGTVGAESLAGLPVSRFSADPTRTDSLVKDPWSVGGDFGATSFVLGFGAGAAESLAGMDASSDSMFISADSKNVFPALGLADGGYYGHFRHDVSERFSFSAGFAKVDQQAPGGYRDPDVEAMTVRATFRPIKSVSLDFTQGYSGERDSAVGTLSSGALALGDKATTMTFGIGASADLGRGFSVRVHMTEGTSSVEAPDSSLFRDVGNVRSRAMGVEVTKAGLFDDADLIGFSFSQPLRVTSGHADLDVPVGRTLGGDVVFDRKKVSLVPDGRQMDMEFSYASRIADNVSAGVHLVHQEDVGHVDGVRADTVFGRVRIGF